MYFNYPNNPTAACASVDFFEKLAQWAKKNEVILCHDNAYSEIYFDGKRQPSFLEAPSAKEVGIEFHSISKTFNMTGWRAGFAVGNEKVIDGLGQVKTNIDSGIFNACQEAAMAALEGPQGDAFCDELRATYQNRRDLLVPALQEIGLECQPPQATFYIWAKTPTGVSSEDFVMKLIREKGIITTPGSGFGSTGEGFVRFTLCLPEQKIKQVAQALKSSV